MVLASSGSGGLADEGGAGQGLEGPGTRPGEATGGGIQDEGLLEGMGVGSGEHASQGNAASTAGTGGAADVEVGDTGGSD